MIDQIVQRFWPIPEEADLMTIEEFVESVKIGLFSNWDGTGYYAFADKMTRIPVDCTGIGLGTYTHVVWFDK